MTKEDNRELESTLVLSSGAPSSQSEEAALSSSSPVRARDERSTGAKNRAHTANKRSSSLDNEDRLPLVKANRESIEYMSVLAEIKGIIG
jgi:hypothetical protein